MGAEYTYDIGKYTIGVDTNGEGGIGLTVAIIENDKINFLGNCYGDNARCIDLLIRENQELKNRLENCYCNRTDCSSRIKNSKKYDSLVQKIEKQQKGFIEYLEDEIKRLEENNIYQPLQRMALETYKHNLSKYKEIIGVDIND